MGYSLVHYLRSFPLKYYLGGGLLGKDDPVVCLFLSQLNSVAALTHRHRLVGLENNISDLPDAPPSIGRAEDRIRGGKSFSSKLLSRSRLKGAPRYLFVPDFGVNDLYCNIHSSSNIREANVENLLESLHEEPKQVIGSWDDPRSFRWTILDSRFDVLRGSIERTVKQLILIGLPDDYCQDVETWVDSQNGALLAIVPVSVACLKWFCQSVPQGDSAAFVVLLLANSALVAVVQRQEVVLLRQFMDYPEVAAREIPLIADELALNDYQIYHWSPESISEELAEELKGIELRGEVLRQINGHPVQIRRPDGSRIETNESIPHLLNWLEACLA